MFQVYLTIRRVPIIDVLKTEGWMGQWVGGWVGIIFIYLNLCI